MNVLIVFGTNSSGTFEASKLVRVVFEEKGHRVTLKRANRANPEDVAKSDAVVLGSCTWELVTPEGKRIDGQLQQHMLEFSEKLKSKKFSGKRFAVFGLGDAAYTHFAMAADHLERLVKSVRGQQVGPTLKIDGFFFDLDGNSKKVMDWAESVARGVGKG